MTLPNPYPKSKHPDRHLVNVWVDEDDWFLIQTFMHHEKAFMPKLAAQVLHHFATSIKALHLQHPDYDATTTKPTTPLINSLLSGIRLRGLDGTGCDQDE